jgi:hypothetical protein
MTLGAGQRSTTEQNHGTDSFRGRYRAVPDWGLLMSQCYDLPDDGPKQRLLDAARAVVAYAYADDSKAALVLVDSNLLRNLGNAVAEFDDPGELTAQDCQAGLLALNGESIHLWEIACHLDHYREKVRDLRDAALCECCGGEVATVGCPNGKQICQACFDDGFDGDTIPE